MILDGSSGRSWLIQLERQFCLFLDQAEGTTRIPLIIYPYTDQVMIEEGDRTDGHAQELVHTYIILRINILYVGSDGEYRLRDGRLQS